MNLTRLLWVEAKVILVKIVTKLVFAAQPVHVDFARRLASIPLELVEHR